MLMLQSQPFLLSQGMPETCCVLQGTLGFGTGKAAEVAVAVRKADQAALKSLFFVPRYADSTIFQLRKVKYGEHLASADHALDSAVLSGLEAARTTAAWSMSGLVQQIAADAATLMTANACTLAHCL